MKIALCDDDVLFLKSLRNKVKVALDKNNIACSIFEYSSSEALLSANNQFDLIFLDIVMDHMDGIDLAEILYRKSSEAKIIFVTGFIQYAPRGYMVKGFRYILKDEIDLMLDEAVQAFIKERERSQTKISLTIGNVAATILVDRILYVESEAHRVHFHFSDSAEVDTVYKTLADIEGLLPRDEFVRIHQSYLVNLRHVKNIVNYTAILTNEETLPVAQKRNADAKKKYYMYRGRI